MTPDRFDTLVHSLSVSRPRRAVLGLAAGLAAALGATRATVVEAKHVAAAKHHQKRHKHHKRKCPQGQEKCATKCCQTGETCASDQCVTGQGTCQAGDDACLGIGDPFCFDASGQHECICQTRLQGGTRCAYFGNASQCDQCETDADCTALGFPPGSACMQDYGGTCVACQDNNKGICAIPCGSPDTTT
jgi:hypothetical protein